MCTKTELMLLSGETNLRRHLNAFYWEGTPFAAQDENGWAGLGGFQNPHYRRNAYTNYAEKIPNDSDNHSQLRGKHALKRDKTDRLVPEG